MEKPCAHLATTTTTTNDSCLCAETSDGHHHMHTRARLQRIANSMVAHRHILFIQRFCSLDCRKLANSINSIFQSSLAIGLRLTIGFSHLSPRRFGVLISRNSNCQLLFRVFASLSCVCCTVCTVRSRSCAGVVFLKNSERRIKMISAKN